MWRNGYALPGAGTRTETRLRAADLALGLPVTACWDTAAALYGFDLWPDARTHVVAPGEWQSKLNGLMFHRTPSMFPLRRIAGREVMDPAEVAVRISNVARASGRKRAIFDAALASGSCSRPELMRAVESLSIRVSGPPA